MKIFSLNIQSVTIKLFVILGITFYLVMPNLVYSDVLDKNQSSEKPLVLGVLPYALPSSLLKRFSGLRNYLSDGLGRNIIVETAANYDEFIKRTAQRKYDIVWTAPHFVLLALDSGHYKTCSTWNRPLEAVIVVNKNSEVNSLKHLANQIVATPSKAAIVTLYAKHHFVNSEHEAPRFQAYEGHNSSYMAAITGKAAAAVIEISVYENAIAKGVPLRIIKRLPKIPGVGILLAKDMPTKLKLDIKALLHKMQTNKKGQKVLETHGFPAYRSATAVEFESLRPFLEFLPKTAKPKPAKKETP